ncbi:methanobactin biosynthesis protein MbnC [Pseudomonas sp. zfem005]|uniref:methanobactin biosynthesis protein MbnC n=1 Tax=Pseudomonas sp. zfem005 TaxID=3078200 RepID=UPI002927DB18|nr:methanobactin biosynthesis protein MbnC [Pseudomonas sp. zfem005]MDU9414366.1 methanobactin biosynthesis cassette protein MbnC [Pseudomonas sp. zfem005]
MPDNPRTDSQLLHALFHPQRQGDYPRDSKAFVRIDTSLRVYWHSLFDICPGLLALSGPDGLAIFRPFMAWAVEQELSFNWAWYLWVDLWLRQSPFHQQVEDELRYSLMAASAARWATGDRSSQRGIVLGAADLPDLVCGWKATSLEAGRQVERLELEEPLPPPGTAHGYFTCEQPDLSGGFPGWTQTPR